ncbi:hypothetical protein GX50_02514 [[Emmonsia] crescens]|uniref:Uncharacterized protein n=1 Tax=[Emmonsia] crescens TaxID=73230 RepID=A0A2B7ZDT0_9EURO|nr:hypothetical protein GX50_02514 [Emmonsia crescens]
MPVPNGYLVFIVMEELPGVPLGDFWSYPLLKRNMIRASFAKSLDYLVDFEGIDVTEDKETLEFDNLYFYIWHLKHESYGKIYQ